MKEGHRDLCILMEILAWTRVWDFNERQLDYNRRQQIRPDADEELHIWKRILSLFFHRMERRNPLWVLCLVVMYRKKLYPETLVFQGVELVVLIYSLVANWILVLSHNHNLSLDNLIQLILYLNRNRISSEDLS